MATRPAFCWRWLPAGVGLDNKALAEARGNKSCELLPLKDVQSVTGYVRGGVSPLGTKKRFPVFLDRTALEHQKVSISAGARGAQVLLAPHEIGRMTQAVVAAVATTGEKDDHCR